MVSLMNDKIKIAISPYNADRPDEYIERMVETIRLVYPNTTVEGFPRFRDLLSLKDKDFVWLNWFEDLPSRGRIKNFLLKEFTLLCMKLMRVKVIVTFHNKEPHDSGNNIWDKLLFRHNFKNADRIIILSSDSNYVLKEKFGKKILNKTVLIPHPTYICKPKCDKGNKNRFSILFFGHLRPYKNIEMIYELARRFNDIGFTIAGNAMDARYEAYLKNEAKDISNITLISRYITADEVDALIDSHSLILLPYDVKSALNSGVVIHAICKHINTIVPAIGTVNQFKNKDKIFSYIYDSPEDHFQKLMDILAFAKDEYENNFEKFEERIDMLYEECMENNTPLALSPKIKELLQI